MKRNLALQQERAAATDSSKAILAALDAENRAMTPEEKTAAAANKARVLEIDGEIRDLEEQAELVRSAPSATAKPAPGVAPVNPEAPQKAGFKSFGEMLVSVAHAAQPGHNIDARLLAGPTGMSEGVPADGGFFVQQDMSSELLRKTFTQGEILQRVRKITVQGNGLKINAVLENSRANGSRWGGVSAAWQGEADTKVGSAPKFRQIDLNLKKLTALCYATDELLQDASALEGVIMEAFAEEMGFRIEDAIIRGTGSGMPLGILESPAKIEQAIEGGQTIANTAASIAVNLAKMWGRMPQRSQQAAVWFINQELLNKLYTATLGGTSAVSGIFIAPGRFNETPFATIFGRPVIPVEYASAEGTVGDLMLVDLTTYLFIDKGGVNSASSIHVRFVNDETVFRFVYRADGAPTWNSPLTPFKGTATQSPYVTLAARS